MCLSDFEGAEEIEGLDSRNRHDPIQMLADMTIEDDEHEWFLTELGEANGTRQYRS
jgi:hypothetical protein